MKQCAVLIGNSDGIGLALTRKLLGEEYFVIGISRSHSPVSHELYTHFVQDVSANDFRETLARILDGIPKVDICIYLVGIGELLDWKELSSQTMVFQVNLMGAVITTELALSKFTRQEFGHFIGVSSLADMCISSSAPSYSASKIGISWFWEGLSLANKNPEIKISNVRFGFVDTKMAKADIKPFLLSVDKAVALIFDVIKAPRARATKPVLLVPILWILQILTRIQIAFR